MTTKELDEIATKMCALMEGIQISDANDVMILVNRKFEDYKRTSPFSTKGLDILKVNFYKNHD